MLRALTAVLEVVGAGLVCTGAFLVGRPVGLIVTGVVITMAALAVEKDTR